ncbi:MAG: histidine phosphatase family protein [Acidimicrobiales bacterium]
MSGAPDGVRIVSPQAESATRLVLVRHGEAVCGVTGVVGGPRGCTGLSELGRTQAEALAHRLEDSGELAGAGAFYSSVLARAVETAAAIAPYVGSGAAARAECSLCELHPGEGDGMKWDEFLAAFGAPRWDTDPTAALAPGGESWRGFVERAAAALEELADRHTGETVVVVCHAGVIESAMLRFLPVAGRERLGLRTAHVSLTEFERDGAQWRLLRYNDSAHLPG